MKQFIIVGINERCDDTGLPLYWSNKIDPLSPEGENQVVGWTNLWALDLETDYFDIFDVKHFDPEDFNNPIVGGRWQSLKEAKQTVLDNCEDNKESVLELSDGYKAITPAHPADCDFVKIISELGEEVVYYVVDEWEESGADVMGAIFGAMKHPKESHEKIKAGK